MSKMEFERAVKSEPLSRAQRTWFPRWLGRYATFMNCSAKAAVVVERERVVEFPRMLRDRGIPAWQRLQAVEAIECYQTLLLGRGESCLATVREKLRELAQRERNTGVAGAKEQSVGRIDAREPALLQETRKALRRMHYSFRTERAYVGWIRRFLGSYEGRDIRSLGENEIKEFLGELATGGRPRDGLAVRVCCSTPFA